MACEALFETKAKADRHYTVLPTGMGEHGFCRVRWKQGIAHCRHGSRKSKGVGWKRPQFQEFRLFDLGFCGTLCSLSEPLTALLKMKPFRQGAY